MIVLDASAILEVLLKGPARPRSPRVSRDTRRVSTLPTSAICLRDPEAIRVLRRYAVSGSLGPALAKEALQDLPDFPLNRYPHEPFLSRIWDLRKNATAYDVAYLALAEALGAPLPTRDAPLRSIPGHRPRVEIV